MKLKLIVLSMLTAMSATGVFGASVKIGDLYYTLTDKTRTAEVAQHADNKRLHNVVVPASVRRDTTDYKVVSLGYSVFSQCDSLESIELPEGLESVGMNAFLACTNLTRIVIPQSVKTLGAHVFRESGLSDVTLPDGLETLPPYAFYACKSLKGIKLPENLKTIDEYAFGSSAIESIDLPATLTSAGKSTFISCSALKSICLPDSVKTVANGMFNGCTVLESVRLSPFTTVIGSESFNNCQALTEIDIPATVKTIGYGALSNCKGLKKVNITDLKAWTQIEYTEYNAQVAKVYNGNPLKSAHALYLNGELVRDLVIPEGTETIKDFAFQDCDSLNSVTFPSSLVEIGKEAFRDCNNLETVNWNNGIRKVGMDAFAAAGVKEVHINDLASWFKIDFDSNGAYYGANPVVTSRKMYMRNRLLRSLSVPAGVDSIKNFAMYRNEGLSSVSIPSSVKYIGEYAFSGCGNITTVRMAAGSVKEIGDFGFTGCSSISKLTLSDCLEKINGWAFANCDALTSIHLPASLKEIGGYAFRYAGIERVDIDDIAAWCAVKFGNEEANPTSRSHNLYLRGQLLRHLFIPDRVKSIGDYAFYGCRDLESVTFGDGIRPLKGNQTFYGCSGLETVTLGLLTDEIANNYFLSCSNIRHVISKYEEPPMVGANTFADATFKEGYLTVPLYSSDFYKDDAVWGKFSNIYESGSYFKFPIITIILCDDAAYVLHTSDGSEAEADYAMARPMAETSEASSTEIILPETVGDGVSVKGIAPGAFQDRPDLTAITLPARLDSIGEDAFVFCTELKKVINLNPEPYDIDSCVFADTTYTRATLAVAQGSLDKYRSHPVWSKFNTIEEYVPSSIEGVANGRLDDMIEINGKSLTVNVGDQHVAVYTAGGACMVNRMVRCGESIDLPHPGVYIVSIGDRSAKITIR